MPAINPYETSYGPSTFAGQQQTPGSGEIELGTGGVDTFAEMRSPAVTEAARTPVIGKAPTSPATQSFDYTGLTITADEMATGNIKSEVSKGIDLPTTPVGTSTAGADLQATGTALAAQGMAQLKEIQAGAQLEYKDDIAKWDAEGKYWFDPARNVEPDLDAYLKSMPKRGEALTESSLPGLIAGAADADVSDAAGSFLFVLERGGMGALAGGAVGNWVGAIVGGVVGVLEGVVELGMARSEDDKNSERVRKEYEKKLKEWQIAKAKRKAANRSYYNQWLQNYRGSREQTAGIREETKQKEKMQSANEKRTNFANMLKGLKEHKQNRRESLRSVWR